MYISKPVQKIVGYIEFNKRINLQDWKESYKNNVEVRNRIEDYILRNYRYAMPINKFKMTTEIPLIDLRSNLEKFIIPESYYYLDNFTDLYKYIKSNIEFTGEIVNNNFKVIDEDDICRKKY